MSGPAGSGVARPVSRFQNHEKTGTYVYVGHKTAGGAWVITRRTISSGARLRATGSSDYSTNWAGRGALPYA